MNDIRKERQAEIGRLRKINSGEIQDTRTDFGYKPGAVGCGCSVCEKRRRLGIGSYDERGTGYGPKVQGRQFR